MNTNLAKINMISQQLRTNDVLNEAILSLYLSIDRSLFAPEPYQSLAYSDMQIPLDDHNRMMTPTEEGKILQALNIQPYERILEIGTGTGFFTCLLSKLGEHVITLDINEQRQAIAKKHHERESCQNIEYVIADGANGYFDKAPFDVIVYTGAIKHLTESQKLQLLLNGRMFVLMGESPAINGVMYHLTHDGEWQKSLLFTTDIPHLTSTTIKPEFIF